MNVIVTTQKKFERELWTYTRYAYFNIKIQYDYFEDEWHTFIAHVPNVIKLKYIPQNFAFTAKIPFTVYNMI